MKIFLAFPFTSKLQQDGLFSKDYKNKLIQLSSNLRKMGHTVIIAHEQEEWGKNILPPDICTKSDFKEISSSDLLIAYPGSPPSGGVHIEIGWASAFKKMIIIIKRDGDSYSPLINGMNEITITSYIVCKDFSDMLISLKKSINIIESNVTP